MSRWAAAVVRVLSDPVAAFRNAATVQRLMAAEYTWRRAAETLLAGVRAAHS